jgi:acetylglutamate kinase
LLAEVAEIVRAGGRVVLIHGGGPEIDRELAERQIPTVRVDGLRVTDAKTLAVTESVLCATVNKAIVRALTALNIPAVGISGQDGGLLICERSEAPCHPEQSAAGASSRDRGDLGFVGTVTRVNPAVITALLDAGFVPVIAPLGIAADGSTAYNVNGDTAAGAIAAALHAQTFILVTNVERVRRDPDDATSGIATMTLAQARTFLASDACRQSMKPKIAAAIAAVESGATAHICAESPTTIANALTGTGTTITA